MLGKAHACKQPAIPCFYIAGIISIFHLQTCTASAYFSCSTSQLVTALLPPWAIQELQARPMVGGWLPPAAARCSRGVCS